MNNLKKFMTDYFPVEKVDELRQKKDGFTLRIKAGVGKGKSYWVGSVLGEVAKRDNEKVLMIMHRLPLKRDIEALFGDMGGLEDTIYTTTYQSITMQLQQGKGMVEDLEQYKYIVYDEFQFVFNDSSFNSATELNVELVKRLQGRTNQIILSANSFPKVISYDEVLDIKDGKETEYDIRDRVNIAYTFRKDSHVRYVINKALEKGEKVAVFMNSTDDIEKLYEEFKDHAIVYVSENNRLANKMNREELDRIAKESRFEASILLATGVMDSGVSLRMKELKHIVIKERSIGAAYQFIGRKRLIDNEDKFDLYMYEYHNTQLGGYKRNIERQLEQVEVFENKRDEFFKKYGRSALDNHLFYTDMFGVMQMNNIRLRMLEYDLKEIDTMIIHGYRNNIKAFFNIHFNSLDKEDELLGKKEMLDKLVGKEMLEVKDRQELIKVINLKSGSKLYRSIDTLNASLEEDGLDYRIVQSSRSITLPNGKRKRYSAIWTLRRLV